VVAVLEIQIFYAKLLIMLYIGTVLILVSLWIAFEIWRAPYGEETEQGFKIIKPAKKLSDLWRKES